MISCLLGLILGCSDADNPKKTTKEPVKESSHSKTVTDVVENAVDKNKSKTVTDVIESQPKTVTDVVESQPKKPIGGPSPVQEPLNGGPYPGLLVSQAWFWKDEKGGINPGPARLDIWRQTKQGWKKTRLEDPDSNVFHKAIQYDGGILTIGAEKAMLKKWMHKDGKWSSEILWSKSWGGKFDRLRDIEIGDVDQDGKEELVIATHDYGVVAVLHPDENNRVDEMDQKADTFVHEIEIGDIDGDGKNEFFATPSDRNTSSKSQGGGIVMYKWNGSEFVRSNVASYTKTHVKEILSADLNGDGTSELFSAMEAEMIGKTIYKPVRIQQYSLQPDGSFQEKTIATFQDRQLRFLLAGDFDSDKQTELIAASMSAGLWMLDPTESGEWKKVLIEKDSSGYEHTCYGSDIDKDGKLELYVAADEQSLLRRYIWNGSSFTSEDIGKIDKNTITWNITTGNF